MCSIIILEPEQMIDEQKLDNTVANNLDGYGIILQGEDNKLEVIRAVTEGGTRTEDVLKIITEGKDRRRFIHLRNQTCGDVTQENAHPFQVFQSDVRDVWMMHNGTIGGYRPKTDDSRSDTKVFADELVSPLLKNYSGEFGPGDYNDPIITNVLQKFGDTGYSNRLLFVSNDLAPLILGSWSKIKNNDGSEFLASNNNYFTSIVRGPRKPAVVPFQQNRTSVGQTWTPLHGSGHNSQATQVIHSQSKAEEKKEEKKELVALEDAGLNANKNKYELPEKSQNMLEYYDDFGLYAITWLKKKEVEAFVRDLEVPDLAELLVAMAESLNQANDDLDVADQQIKELQKGLFTGDLEDIDSYEELKTEVEILQTKHERATKLIASLCTEKQDLRRELEAARAMINGEYQNKAAA